MPTFQTLSRNYFQTYANKMYEYLINNETAKAEITKNVKSTHKYLDNDFKYIPIGLDKKRREVGLEISMYQNDTFIEKTDNCGHIIPDKYYQLTLYEVQLHYSRDKLPYGVAFIKLYAPTMEKAKEIVELLVKTKKEEIKKKNYLSVIY